MRGFLFLIVLVAGLYFFPFSGKEDVAAVEPTSSQELSVESNIQLELKKEMEKGLGEKDLLKVKESIEFEGHQVKQMKIVDNVIHMELEKIEIEIDDDFVYQTDDDRNEYLMSFNQSQQLPETVNGEEEFLDDIVADLNP